MPPLGLGLGLLAVRVLGLFFILPPPLLSIPVGALVAFVALMVVASRWPWVALWSG